MGQQASTAVLASTAVSVLAGGVGSAIGVGVAFPIDSLKTKTQVKVCTKGTADETVFSRARNSYRHEGIAGFYGGLIPTMVGSALISGVSLSSNHLAVCAINASNFMGGGAGGRAVTPFVTLLLAAFFAAFVQTFVIVPVGKFASLFFSLLNHISKDQGPSRLKRTHQHVIFTQLTRFLSGNKRSSQSYDASSRKSILVRQRARMH